MRVTAKTSIGTLLATVAAALVVAAPAVAADGGATAGSTTKKSTKSASDTTTTTGGATSTGGGGATIGASLLSSSSASQPVVPGSKAKIVKGKAYAPSLAPDSVKKAIWAANKIIGRPYVYGGGHASFTSRGYDCSGTVSYALHGAGLLKSPLASYDYFGWGQSGKGQWVTIYTNSGHMYMTVAGIRFDTSGRGPKGSRWQTAMRDNSGFQIRHPAGL